ncbi:MAG: hypothetical protein LBC99_00275 [Spirochaetota bacterium]|jgi:hypothetical protein|nr:hypothetical protein [Spirochaetota bacterium]
MSQADAWLLLCTRELEYLRKLSRLNIRLLAHGRDMDYPSVISLLGEYNSILLMLRESRSARASWRDLSPDMPPLSALLARREAFTARQQERVSPVLDRILSACPQVPKHLVLDASGRFTVSE